MQRSSPRLCTSCGDRGRLRGPCARATPEGAHSGRVENKGAHPGTGPCPIAYHRQTEKAPVQPSSPGSGFPSRRTGTPLANLSAGGIALEFGITSGGDAERVHASPRSQRRGVQDPGRVARLRGSMLTQGQEVPFGRIPTRRPQRRVERSRKRQGVKGVDSPAANPLRGFRGSNIAVLVPLFTHPALLQTDPILPGIAHFNWQ